MNKIILRALHDSLMVIKRMLESNVLVAGGGAVETALSIYLESFATTLGSREQLAIAEFAEALLVIPKTLAVNAAQVRNIAVVVVVVVFGQSSFFAAVKCRDCCRCFCRYFSPVAAVKCRVVVVFSVC